MYIDWQLHCVVNTTIIHGVNVDCALGASSVADVSENYTAST
jgi:hypothetical protein